MEDVHSHMPGQLALQNCCGAGYPPPINIGDAYTGTGTTALHVLLGRERPTS